MNSKPLQEAKQFPVAKLILIYSFPQKLVIWITATLDNKNML